MECDGTNVVQGSDNGTTGFDPDVAGPGVVIAFILTGFLAFLFSCFSSGLRVHLQQQNQVRTLNPSSAPKTAVAVAGSSTLDKLLKYFAPPTENDPTTFWIATLERFLITLSDQQLITGLLLIILSYVKYYGREFFSLLAATDLVFFAALTHAATLLVLRAYLRKHPKMAAVRLAIAILTFTLWAAAVICIFAQTLDTPLLEKVWSSPHRAINIVATITELAELLGLFWVYVNLTIGLWLSDTAIEARVAMSNIWAKDLSQLQTWIDECNDKHDFFLQRMGYKWPVLYIEWQISRFCTYYIYVGPSWARAGLWVMAEILFPWATRMYLLGLLFTSGVTNLALDLYQSGLSKSWTFGQLLPVFLILLPIFTFFETYGDEPKSNRQIYITSAGR